MAWGKRKACVASFDEVKRSASARVLRPQVASCWSGRWTGPGAACWWREIAAPAGAGVLVHERLSLARHR